MSRVCPTPRCPELQPCPTHGKPANAHWSPDRDRGAQARFRRSVLKRDRHRCQRCGLHDPTGKKLDAHHLRPGYETDAGTTLCNSRGNGCHRSVDPHAR